jgi:hypothetical protein
MSMLVAAPAALTGVEGPSSNDGRRMQVVGVTSQARAGGEALPLIILRVGDHMDTMLTIFFQRADSIAMWRPVLLLVAVLPAS